MEQAEFERLRQELVEKISERFAGAPVERVEVLQYGDEPEIEPGQLLARVTVAVSGEGEERMQAFEAFHDAHRKTFRELRDGLDKLPTRVVLEFTAADDQEKGPKRVIKLGGGPGPGTVGPGLTSVMARVGAEDLETLDTLIAAGIANSRAEAVRWTLARIRERPAYEQLRARTREIADLKSQF
jgi:hypothetical protein